MKERWAIFKTQGWWPTKGTIKLIDGSIVNRQSLCQCLRQLIDEELASATNLQLLCHCREDSAAPLLENEELNSSSQ